MKRFSDHNEHLDTDLNIVPIIDCFVMLICFLLFTAAFTQLVYLEAKITSNTAAAASKSRSELDAFRLVVTFEDSGWKLATTGSSAKKFSTSVPKINGDYDYAALHKSLIELKTQYPDRYSVDIEFKQKNGEAVAYEQIVKTIDSVRHLSDDEYGALRTAGKKLQNIELSDSEKEKKIDDNMNLLAQSILANETAKNADQKVLFPDVALVGL